MASNTETGAAAGSFFGPAGAAAGAVIGGITDWIGGKKKRKAQRRAARAAQAAQEAAHKRANEALYSGMYGSSSGSTAKEFKEILDMHEGVGLGKIAGAMALSEHLKQYEGKPIDEIPEKFRKYFNEHIGRKGSLGYLDDAQSQALGYLDKGRASQLGALESGRDAASQYYQPYSQAGEQALGAYQTAMQEGYDPTQSKSFQLKQQLADKYLGQQLSAAGKARSGVGIAQYSLPAYAQMVQQGEEDYFSRLNPLMKYGYGANKELANIQTGYGQEVSAVEGLDSVNRAKMAEALGVNRAGLAERYGDRVGELALGLGDYSAGTQLRVGNINAAEAEAPWRILSNTIDKIGGN